MPRTRLAPVYLLINDESKILGMEIPQWTEYIRDETKLDMLTYARLVAYSEVCWTKAQNRNYDDFENRMENLRACPLSANTLRFRC